MTNCRIDHAGRDRPIRPASPLVTRRTAVLGGLAAACTLAARPTFAAATDTAPRVRFLGAPEAAAALTQGPDAAYFERMGRCELAARLGRASSGLDVVAARRDLRHFEADRALAFTDREAAAIRAVIEHMQPQLIERAPLYARTPWSFIKVAQEIEGGMPHTRGPHVVLPAPFCARIADAADRLAAAGANAGAASLLVHEQTHVLQRADPARFEALYTDVFGFTHLPSPLTTPWLDDHGVQNPDAPDAAWAFPLFKLGGSGWIMPSIVLPDSGDARSPGLSAFTPVAIALKRDADGWRIDLDADGRPRRRHLDSVPGYDRHFPFPDEAIHPNEIAAVALSHWVLRDVPDIDQRPRIAGLADWARSALA